VTGAVFSPTRAKALQQVACETIPQKVRNNYAPTPELDQPRLDAIAKNIESGRITEDAASKLLLAEGLFEALVARYRTDPQLRIRLVRDFVCVGRKVGHP
jgi:hypothetical protein